MDHPQLNWIANFIWGIADDVLRDLYVRGKYRDVILPMMVLRRLDSLLEPSTLAVLAMKTSLDKAKIIHQDQALRQAAKQAFYNTSRFTLRDLRARASQQQLKADFEAYLAGFSPNAQDILEKFEFRNQLPRLSKADALGTLIEKFLSPDVNLSPHPVLHGDGSIKQPGLDNHAMGTIFEELVRRFNEENNEEAGEHWTPRDAVTLMAKLVFVPVADRIDSGTYLVYDGACGTGGMLTAAEETLTQIARQRGKQVAFRGDAAFAKPEIYEALEERGVQYAIRIPANKSLELEIEDIFVSAAGKALPEALGALQEFSLSGGELVQAATHCRQGRASPGRAVPAGRIHRDEHELAKPLGGTLLQQARHGGARPSHRFRKFFGRSIDPAGVAASAWQPSGPSIAFPSTRSAGIFKQPSSPKTATSATGC